MAILNIFKFPNPILKKKSKAVNVVTEEERRIIDDMIQTMRASQGVGLAAPQVGILKRIIVIEAMEEFNQPIDLINPKITKRKGRSVFCEGCLSIPEVEGDVLRSKKVKIEALDKNGENLTIESAGLFARVVQHEIDHLDGILFIDRIGFLKRRRLLKKYKVDRCVKL